jgi:hypothetical protein
MVGVVLVGPGKGLSIGMFDETFDEMLSLAGLGLLLAHGLDVQFRLGPLR